MGFVHSTRRQILFGECDAAGIVYYPRYFEMIDANTSAMFSVALGLSQHGMEETYGIIGCPMVKASTNFHSPATYGDDVVIISEVLRVGISSITVKSRINHADGKLVVETEDVRVWATKLNGMITSKPVPDCVRSRFLI